MVCVNPGNDAFAAAVSVANKALDSRVVPRFAVGINRGKENLVVVLASIGASSASHVEQREIADIGEMQSALSDFARRAEVSKIDLVFLNDSNEGEYRRKWVLVDPLTLEPRLVNGVAIEAAFNPI